MKVTTKYAGGMRFTSGEGAAKVVMDAPEIAGGKGEALTPKEVVLQGLVGCTGLDVAAMLEKHGVAFESLEIDAEAEQTRTTPKVFAKIALVYRVVADPAARESIERAIVASQKRFCGVSEMLRKTADLTWTLEIVAPGA